MLQNGLEKRSGLDRRTRLGDNEKTGLLILDLLNGVSRDDRI